MDAGIAKLRGKLLQAERDLDDAKRDYRLGGGAPELEAATAKAAQVVDALHQDVANLSRQAWNSFGARRAA